MQELIRSTVWNGFSDFVQQLGGDPDAILVAARVDRSLLSLPDIYLPLRQWIDTQNETARQLKRQDIGLLLGKKQTIENLGPLSLVLSTAETPRKAIQAFSRFMHIHSPASVLTLDPLPNPRQQLLSCRVVLSDETGRTQNDERIVSGLHTGLKLLAGAAYKPRGVWFAHTPVSPPSVYRRTFGITPQFDKPAMGILIDREVLDRPRPEGSSVLRGIAEDFLKKMDSPASLPLAQRIANMSRSMLSSGAFSPRQVAHALGLHERTVQRRLRQEGTTFEEIKDRARRDWAESLLRQAALPMSQIALMLGYADSSAFTRSCRRWFGEPPLRHRARLMAARKQGRPRVSRVNSFEANVRARRRAGV